MEAENKVVGVSGHNPPRGWVTAYARHAGCDKAYVSRLVNKRGMPVDRGADPQSWTFESADRWRVAHASEGVGHKSRGFRDDAVSPASAGLMSHTVVNDVARALTAGKPVDQQAGPDARGDGLEAMAARARASERQAYQSLEAAFAASRMDFSGDLPAERVIEARRDAAASLPGLLRTYTQASRARLDVERRVCDELERRKVLAQVDEVWHAVQETVSPLIDGLQQLPKLVGVRANRENPNLAEAAIADEVNALLAKAQRLAAGRTAA